MIFLFSRILEIFFETEKKKKNFTKNFIKLYNFLIMTSIDRLLIQGIRSFGPQNRNIIEFYHPLTIIVGSNGAGKTVKKKNIF